MKKNRSPENAVRHVPERTCIGCKMTRPKSELLRIVKSPEGEYAVDQKGKMPGRGAYICKNLECYQKAVKNHGFERSFRSVPDGKILDSIGEFLKNGEKKETQIIEA